PGGVSLTRRCNWATLRTRSPANSRMTSLASTPALAAGPSSSTWVTTAPYSPGNFNSRALSALTSFKRTPIHDPLPSDVTTLVLISGSDSSARITPRLTSETTTMANSQVTLFGVIALLPPKSCEKNQLPHAKTPSAKQTKGELLYCFADLCGFAPLREMFLLCLRFLHALPTSG